MTRYLVETATEQDTYCTDTPEQAVHAFLNDHPNEVLGRHVEVYVLDFIGKFSQETRIIRHPRQTKPDSPHAIAAQPAP